MGEGEHWSRSTSNLHDAEFGQGGFVKGVPDGGGEVLGLTDVAGLSGSGGFGWEDVGCWWF